MNMIVPRTAAEEALGLSLPHRRMEDWKWTDLRRMVQAPYVRMPVTAKQADVDRLVRSSPFATVKAQRIVFVNGELDASRSSLASSPSQALAVADDDVLLQINRKLEARGATLRLEGNASLPVEIVHVVTDDVPRGVATHHRIEVADGASATLIETYVGEGDYLSSAVVEVALGEGARLDRIKAERESVRATHLASVKVSLAKGAILRDFTLSSGAALNRQDGSYIFEGKRADARISGAYLLGGKQHADTKLVVDHTVPSCTSRELFKVAMDGQSRGIFQGKAIVRPGAQKTDGKQSSHALLLSEEAEFDAKPELEIYADDVVCGHGATSGDLSHDHLFYLRSRGIPEKEAKSLLIAAFVGEAFDGIEHEGVREALTSYAEGWLARR